jgi:signal transduction histidine kinase
MNRPLHTWLLFSVCLLVLLGAIGWVTVTTVQLDRAQMEAAQQAEQEEKIRLALWRMDSWLLPLFIEESARPPDAYQAFFHAEQAFTKGGATIKPGDVLLPSPLLAYTSSNILLHFDFVPGKALTSPQVPVNSLRAAAVANYVDADQLRESEARLAVLDKFLLSPAPQPPQVASQSSWTLSSSAPAPVPALGLNNGDVLAKVLPSPSPNTAPRQQIEIAQTAQQDANQSANLNAPAQMPAQVLEPQTQQRYDNRMQMVRNSVEYNARGNFYQQAKQTAFDNQNASISNVKARRVPTAAPAGAGLFKAAWLGDQLFLVRQVELNGQNHVQGCWLNWTNIQRALVQSIADLAPQASLMPVASPISDPAARMLAAIPVKLLPGPSAAGLMPSWSPVRTLLALAWAGILLAGLATAFLLQNTLALSERRAAFVSSVTHELRTPLTTFRMYSEMLAEGMVKDPVKQKQYLDTLCSEASRLSHLVENVLAYARLERGSARRNVEKTTLGSLLERVNPRLEQRATQVGMRLVVDADESALRAPVQVDVSVVEQILFNLVDNACKYAAPCAEEKIIHLEAFSPANGSRHAMLRVRDHGRGISAEGARRLFQPFSKSAHEAAHSAPGVGLGLALCRRLSRSLGGDLRWISAIRNGACFELAIPTQVPAAKAN